MPQFGEASKFLAEFKWVSNSFGGLPLFNHVNTWNMSIFEGLPRGQSYLKNTDLKELQSAIGPFVEYAETCAGWLTELEGIVIAMNSNVCCSTVESLWSSKGLKCWLNFHWLLIKLTVGHCLLPAYQIKLRQGRLSISTTTNLLAHFRINYF